MSQKLEKAAGRAEFKCIHDMEAFDSSSDNPRVALRWSGDEAETQRLQRGAYPPLSAVDFIWRCSCCDCRAFGVALSFVN